ncbi:hypothetical protein A2767_02715 [Candidatus Roizmanbacteria bacterium RIFCSPHIGHO2_01_FULL_35_10]|uniref:Uncharacterized protein n=1 Tax=Candidatus Roizmanbacteria bacterium RIFCSPLOWO2_01_FULL_35_13 TaxID=1802055 RepID=A0A1F7IF37_9BACT|nr:MAG: hypothetical protein A2767_02715 [Candidatus Roizmanbacteria bacterium RIFCSPHIGHO2_01_FULL_35_10]OGK41957.1 MAG: hypothetical protein A3A74_04640 [Candidatus Roizmanbacteria bacterium RIFCSPLOWO2_01_FULL_35_13]
MKNYMRIISAIVLIISDLVIFFSLIVRTRTAANIIEGFSTQQRLNPEYWTYGLSSEIIIFFSSMLLSFILGILFLDLTMKLIKKESINKLVLISTLIVVAIQIFIKVWSINTSIQESKESAESLKQMAEKADRKTVTDLGIIWYLQDPILCKNMESTSMLLSCMDGFNNINLFTPDYCQVLKDEENVEICILALAGKQKNKDICYLIKSESTKNSCLQEATNNK